MRIEPAAIPGMRVTIMGLGIQGGGLPTALYFARHGATVTVTDLRSQQILRESMEQLRAFPVRYVLERHEESDFTHTDLVIKNPAVPPSSPFLQKAREMGVAIETDLSVFLALAANPVIAITGSKGKSTTASAVAFGLGRAHPGTRLGGNITVSPLSFLDELEPRSPVVLEISSWQLGDLKGRGILKPFISAFTVILPDHLDRYAGMTEYVSDKKAVFLDQQPEQNAVFNLDDPWQRDFPRETKARVFTYSASALPPETAGAWLEQESGMVRITPGEAGSRILATSRLFGNHNRMNLLCAGLVLRLFGMKPEEVLEALGKFPGVEHRLEMFREWHGIRFYNDSAATIPHATAEALKSLPAPIVLITGGTDKNIDFTPLAETADAAQAIVLLAGTGTDKMLPLLDSRGLAYVGPFDDLRKAAEAAVTRAAACADAHGKGASILFSPGCTSFGMFLNEFDRGRKFKEVVSALTEGRSDRRAAR